MSGASPYESLLIADAGDVYLTMYNLPQAADDIYRQYGKLLSTGCKLLSIGGDHTITYPILKAYRVRNALRGAATSSVHVCFSSAMNNMYRCLAGADHI